MARIGEICFGGRSTTSLSGAEIKSAAAFVLGAPAPCSMVYAPRDARWEAEVRKGQLMTVARSQHAFDRSDILAEGLEYIQRCLDLISFERKAGLLVKRASEEHILLFRRQSACVVQHVAVHPLSVMLNATVKVIDATGNVTEPPEQEQKWTRALRYYRLSQTSRDLHDAYRSLWLGFEALLSVVCTPRNGERERDWLMRALTAASQSFDMGAFAPAGRDPVAYIVGTQYEHMRCRLFHSKESTDDAIQQPGPEEVGMAYERLLPLWRKVAEQCLSVLPGRAGAMTHSGFAMMVERTIAGGLSMHFTDDPSPPRKEDTEITPLGRPIVTMDAVTYLGETSPGRHSVLGSFVMPQVDAPSRLMRICTMTPRALMTVATVEDGLDLEGIDCLESHQAFRLVNRGLPRVVFGDEA